MNPLAKHGVYGEGNMENISKTISIDISRNPGIINSMFISVDCSKKEIFTNNALFKEF
jgi:hypothetical protein